MINDWLPSRPCWAEIDLDAITHNVRALCERAAPARLYAIVKANAYGHGAVMVGRTAIEAGAPGLGVVCVDEGAELREGGIEAPVLVVGATFADEAKRIVELRLTPVVGSMQVALALSRFASEAGVTQRVHVELESGLNRHGLPLGDLVPFAEALRALPNIEVEGLFTHFAAAEEGDASFTRAQYDALLVASARLPWIPVRHCAASASVLNAATGRAPEMRLDMVRAGLGIYGYEPAPGIAGDLELRPALSLKSRIARVIDVEPGGTVGYGRTWTAAGPSRIALIMCGYADGYRRALSNKASVLVRGQRAPIAGRVAMDMCMADVTDIAGAAVEDEVVLIGRQGAEAIDADGVAELVDTISWEVLAGIAARVPRLYLRGGEPVAFTDLNHRLPEAVGAEARAG